MLRLTCAYCSTDFESQFAKTLAIVNGSGEFVQKAEEGDTVGLVLDRTSFYSEGGGQAADKGMVTSVKVSY